ncbi:MAG: hypothetical protein WCN98_00475 [Verrucomicrobiaceae bacterium]
MIYSVQQIKFEILSYIKECGANFSAWYIGIAFHPKKAMRELHGVDEDRDIWFCKQAMSQRACETIRNYFVQTLGVDGKYDGTDSGNCIYLFKKSERTRPAEGVEEGSSVAATQSD